MRLRFYFIICTICFKRKVVELTVKGYVKLERYEKKLTRNFEILLDIDEYGLKLKLL